MRSQRSSAMRILQHSLIRWIQDIRSHCYCPSSQRTSDNCNYCSSSTASHPFRHGFQAPTEAHVLAVAVSGARVPRDPRPAHGSRGGSVGRSRARPSSSSPSSGYTGPAPSASSALSSSGNEVLLDSYLDLVPHLAKDIQALLLGPLGSGWVLE